MLSERGSIKPTLNSLVNAGWLWLWCGYVMDKQEFSS